MRTVGINLVVLIKRKWMRHVTGVETATTRLALGGIWVRLFLDLLMPSTTAFRFFGGNYTIKRKVSARFGSFGHTKQGQAMDGFLH